MTWMNVLLILLYFFNQTNFRMLVFGLPNLLLRFNLLLGKNIPKLLESYNILFPFNLPSTQPFKNKLQMV